MLAGSGMHAAYACSILRSLVNDRSRATIVHLHGSFGKREHTGAPRTPPRVSIARVQSTMRSAHVLHPRASRGADRFRWRGSVQAYPPPPTHTHTRGAGGKPTEFCSIAIRTLVGTLWASIDSPGAVGRHDTPAPKVVGERHRLATRRRTAVECEPGGCGRRTERERREHRR